MSYRRGTRVKWDWSKGTGTGQVVKKFTESVTLTIDGTDVTCHATADDPAYQIEQCDGDAVLKSDSELRKVS
ncbi:DUF2945 domain-containing protein [Yoonia litorea]|nr:DUF2945 domain-containing protein [Yoonia litorea]